MKHIVIIKNLKNEKEQEEIEFQLEEFEVQIKDEENEVLYDSRNYNC